MFDCIHAGVDGAPFWWRFRRGCPIRPTLSKVFERVQLKLLFSRIAEERKCSISLEQVELVERFNWSQNDILGGGGQFSQISKIACGEWMYRRQKKCFRNLKVFIMVRFTPISMDGISYGSFRKSGGSEMWGERYKDDYSEGKK